MSDIPWKTFTTERDGVKLEVTWWDHDFTARYKVGDITLKCGRHIMAMCPMKYSEQWLKNNFWKEGLYACFKEAGEIITNQTVFFEAAKAQFAITKKKQEKQFETLNSQIRELRQKFKAGELTQSEYQKMREPLEEQKDEIEFDYDTIKYKIIDEIAPINKDTRGIIGDYLDKLWFSCDLELLFAWKIFVPDNDDFYTKEQEKFEAELKRGHYDFEKIYGKTDKTKCLYFLPNITKDDLENFWDQFSNVYGYRAYQKKLTDEEKQNELDVFLESKNLKKEYPLSLLTLSENFRKRYSHKSPEQIMSEAKVYIRKASKHTGKERWYYRGRMYHHPQAWELEQGVRNKYWEQWKKEN